MGGTAHPAEVPARPEIAHAHLGIGFEAAAGEHDGFRRDLGIALLAADLDTCDDAVGALHQADKSGAIADINPEFLRASKLCLDEACAPTDGLDVDASVEVMLAVDHEGLSSVHRHKADTVATQPSHRRARSIDQDIG